MDERDALEHFSTFNLVEVMLMYSIGLRLSVSVSISLRVVNMYSSKLLRLLDYKFKFLSVFNLSTMMRPILL